MKHIHSIENIDIYMVVVSSFFTNCYILSDKNKDCLIIDPGDNASKIINSIDRLHLKPAMITVTHCHIDHLMAVNQLKDHYGASFYAHAKSREFIQYLPVQLEMFGFNGIEIPRIDITLEEGDILFERFKVIHTPGHSPDAICLYADNTLFSGDTLFRSGIGRTDLPGGNYDIIIDSIKSKLLVLPPDTIVFPGHGPHTFIEHERDKNPFL